MLPGMDERAASAVARLLLDSPPLRQADAVKPLQFGREVRAREGR
jgi:hypothetical protein